MSQVVCITGMHRSGTSLITSWLESSGLVTHDGSLLGPSAGNPKGNFEDKDFVDIHKEGIKSQYPDSKGWQLFSPDQLNISGEQHRHLEDLVNKRSEKYQVWGWKDPRSVFFLDEWKKVIPGLKMLFLWRPCGEVVRSLVNRSAEARFDVFKVGKEESVLMWMTYNTLVLRHMRKYPCDSILFNTRDIISKGHQSFAKIDELLENNLSYSDFMNTFDAKLFKSDSIDESEYRDHLESVHSIELELDLLSEK